VNIVPGRSLSWRVRFFEEDGTTEIDITSDTFDCDIKSLDGTLFTSITSGSGIAQSDTHEITCSLDETVTDGFDHELTYEYQINWNQGADVITAAYGTLEFLKPIIT
jgi:hypothetical protein